MPEARKVVQDLAVEHGACIRPLQLRRTDLTTGEVEQVLVPCGHTLASVCPSCAERAKVLRAARCAGRWAAEIEASRKKPIPGLEPKTVVNTHRMLHQAWEDFAVWGWAKRNVVSDAHPPRVPRKGRMVWTVVQLRTFLQRARSDRFFALWVLEATSGMRRCELAGARRDLLDLDAGTLAIEVTRVVVDGKVIESDGKTENAQHVLALDPFTLAVFEDSRRTARPGATGVRA